MAILGTWSLTGSLQPTLLSEFREGWPERYGQKKKLYNIGFFLKILLKVMCEILMQIKKYLIFIMGVFNGTAKYSCILWIQYLHPYADIQVL